MQESPEKKYGGTRVAGGISFSNICVHHARRLLWVTSFQVAEANANSVASGSGKVPVV